MSVAGECRPEFPPQGTLYPKGLPSGVYHRRVPAEAFAARRQVLREDLDPARDLYAYVHQVKVYDIPRKRVCFSLEAASRGQAAWDLDACSEDAGVLNPPENVLAPTPEPRGCEVLISATLPSGTSLAVVVSNFWPSFRVILEPKYWGCPDTRTADGAFAGRVRKRLLGALESNIYNSERHFRLSMENKFSRTYGYEVNPVDSGQRRRVFSVRVSCSSTSMLRRAVRILQELPAQKGFTPEEFRRLSPEFKFMDDRSLPPNSWCVIPRRTYRVLSEDEPTPSLRTRVVEVQIQNILGLERARQAAGPNRFKDAPDENYIPPTLFAYADIEARSQALEEFPDPTRPNAPCYIVGVSFAWAFDVPPCFRRPRIHETVQSEEERVTSIWKREETQKVLERTLKKRMERRALRAQRLQRYADKKYMQDMFAESSNGVADLNSDDESVGSDAEDARALESVTADADEQLARGKAQAQTYAWPRKMGEQLWRTVPSWSLPDVDVQEKRGIVAEYPFLRVLLVLGTCAPIEGAVVVTFDTERDLLRYLRVLLAGLLDVDGIRGYNWLNFDSTYIARRSELLGIHKDVLRLTHVPDHIEYDAEPYGLALQTGRFSITRVPGTNTIDMYAFMRQNYRLSSYKLENIAQNFGLAGKHPIEVKHIYYGFDGSDDERAVVAAYCAQDCDLLIHVARRSQFEVTLTQFARIMLTPAELMWSSGQQIRLLHQIVYTAHRSCFIVDQIGVKHPDPALTDLDSGKRFDGGFVMEPLRGHYTTPTATLDYKSLYPSIMIGYTLCPTTAILGSPEEAARTADLIRRAGVEVLRVDTSGGSFYWIQHARNLIPTILRRLWDERQATKKLEKKATGSMKIVHNKKQLAIKVSMNSFFGGQGAEHGIYEMLRAAHTITHVGRTTVQAAAQYANTLESAPWSVGGKVVDLLARTPKEKEENPDMRVHPLTVYGDTDSIMVNMPQPNSIFLEALRQSSRADPQLGICKNDVSARPTVSETLLYTEALAEFISEKLNATYRAPIELEFEEVAIQANFLQPKMYVKCLLEGITDDDLRSAAQGHPIGTLKASGISAVRRDRAAYVRRLQKDVATAFIMQQDESRALQLVRRRLFRLALGEVPFEDLVTTTELKNETPDIQRAPPPPHVAVAWAMERLHPGMQPKRGDRVEWVAGKHADASRLLPPPRLLSAYPHLMRLEELDQRKKPRTFKQRAQGLSAEDRRLLRERNQFATRRISCRSVYARHVSEVDAKTFAKRSMDRAEYLKSAVAQLEILFATRPDLLRRVQRYGADAEKLSKGQVVFRSFFKRGRPKEAVSESS